MSKTFIEEVHSIVTNNLANEQFGVKELANALGLSSSQTLRKIKGATGKSVNQYIRELRLEKGAELIKNTDLTAAEIAYQVGFNSASYFNKTFNDYFGVAPGEYKTLNSRINQQDLEKEEKLRFFTTNKKMAFVVGLILILLSTFTILKLSFRNAKQTPSIAVLPFKDLSPENTRWFCDGIADNILHSFAQIGDLKVISFTSSATYRDSDKQISQIAKELNVAYVLEGSVTLFKDSINVITQLINLDDEHVWSHEYNDSFKNAIGIQNNVAQEVMNRMQVTLSQEDEEVLNKFPTDNMEAFSLHLKGELDYMKQNTLEELEASIKLNKQAISLDSTFADAYASISESYFVISHFYYDKINPIEYRDKADQFADKALTLDSKNVVALLVKGNLNKYVDWDIALEYFKTAVATNPNHAVANQELANYYVVNPNIDNEKALKLYEKAFKLDPISRLRNINYFNSLLANERLDELEKRAIENKFLFTEAERRLWQHLVNAHKDKNWSSLFNTNDNRNEDQPDDPMLYYHDAMYYRFVSRDNTKAIEYAKKAYQIDSSFIYYYVECLIEGKRFNEAKSVMELEAYDKYTDDKAKKTQQWSLLYCQKKYDQSLEILKDTEFTNQYWEPALTYAALNNRKKVDSLNTIFPWGTGRKIDWRSRRAILHALLKDKDSMYYYLDHIQFDMWAWYAYSRKEFDPYRTEDRFKAFEKKWFLH